MRLPIAAIAAAFFIAPAAMAASDIQLPYSQFTLKNGLRVVVHEDHKAPVVAVSVWYHVGSKDEPQGKTGFAHLFEHLMFNGSENFKGEWFQPLEEVGATDVNGTTWFDRTNYFETVPTTALDRILWMESDRMGHLTGGIDQAKLDEQRGVVQNEKRQGDNQPYGRTEYAVLENLTPAGHPYHHSTIGSMEDLNAASLETVKDWFRQYYGPSNAVLVLAGDIDEKTARSIVEKYFGDIPAGSALTRLKADAPKLDVNKFGLMYDQVAQSRINRNWVAPGRTTRDEVLLELATSVLGGGKTSRLYQKLVHDMEIATRATANIDPHELMSFYNVIVDAKKDEDLDKVQAAMEGVIADFLAKGPTSAELERAKTSIKADIVRGLEKVGGFGGQAVTLAQGAVYADDPGFILKQLEWLDEATPQTVLAAARSVMNAGFYQLEILPFPEHSTTASGVDRAHGVPAVATTPDLSFPAVSEAQLSNGMKVVVVTRNALPLVEVALQFDAGYAADSVAGGHLGAASFASAMLDEGTKRRSSLQIAQELESLGATLAINSNLDTTDLSVSALKENLKPSLDLLADVARNPAFDTTELEKQRVRWLAQIAREKAQPVTLALRLLPPEIYGKDNAYGVPLTGSGTVESVKSLTRDDLVRFQQTWLRPDNGVIFVVGDTTMDEVKPMLERAFGDWRAPSSPLPKKNLAHVDRPTSARVILVDKPGAPQTMILAGEVAPPSGAPNNVAITAMNDILGGQFTSRVNMNLREDKHWAYGAFTFMPGAIGQRPFFVYAPVQTDKTKESLIELGKELAAINAVKPPTTDELQRTILNETRSLPGSFETSDDVLGSLQSSARFGRPWNYPATLKGKFEALKIPDVKAAAGEVVHPEGLVWVIIGDRSKIEAGVRSLNLGPVEVRSADQL
ncbi:MAG TPA: pitrilysin family protein [Parvularculaceae bacterium]|nr:pitrilysin family protein [Parvularculaceae bacterium]